VLEYTSLPDSTPQRHAATIPGIKLSHHVHFIRYNLGGQMNGVEIGRACGTWWREEECIHGYSGNA